MRHPYNKKFSIAHWDNLDSDDFFINSLANSSEQYRKEIYDLYFGSTFVDDTIQYGNTMGTNATPGQYKNLLKIQDKYNVPISLTLNEMNRPFQLLQPAILKNLIKFIKKYYDDGVRSCTISHVHLMRTGALQSEFPEMQWKNTVNHGIKSTQEFINYVKLGYNVVQLDRDFNRNFSELKRVSQEADRLKIKTCLLIKEGCMPECPFKVEHDCWQSSKDLKDTGKNYWQTVDFTCGHWNKVSSDYEKDVGVTNPRTGTDIMIHAKDDWDEFAGLTDIFKMAGRLHNTKHDDLEESFCRSFETRQDKTKLPYTTLFRVDSFKQVYDHNLAPFHMWLTSSAVKKNYPRLTDIKEIKKHTASHFWNTEKAITLSKILKNCKNQCYKCHKCDELFGTKELDSILEL